MFECECGRKFKTEGILNLHKRYCGKIFDYNGYNVFIGDDGREVFVHRFIMEEILGRKLEPWEDVHHKDGNKKNNHPSNLEVLSKSEHTKIHWRQKDHDDLGNRKEAGKKISIALSGRSKKLSKDDVRNIKIQLENGVGLSVLGRQYSVDRTTIRDIRDNKIWKTKQFNVGVSRF